MEPARLNGPRAAQVTKPPQFAYGTEVLNHRVKQLLDRIQPNAESVRRREQLFNYVHDLIRRCFANHKVAVFTFGSVPLKTYLPDGDIDVTISVPMNQPLPEPWTARLKDFLGEHADSNPLAVIRGITIIKAEVELLKCLIDNVVVDISYQQIGGMGTVAFLEDMDRNVDAALVASADAERGGGGGGSGGAPDTPRPFLFKRSIILVKAYCYYEARLLGAHHSLLSTYALEVLVLYVINHYHERARTPLAVLYIFLRTFGDFDWATSAISLYGPVLLSATYKITAQGPSVAEAATSPHDGSQFPLIPPSTLAACIAEYSHRHTKTTQRLFSARQVNIIDPLMETNNLGRSVTKASAVRIQSAFRYTAQALDQIFQEAEVDVIAAIHRLDAMFRNTWAAQKMPYLYGQGHMLLEQPPLLRSPHPPGSANVNASAGPDAKAALAAQLQLSLLGSSPQAGPWAAPHAPWGGAYAPAPDSNGALPPPHAHAPPREPSPPPGALERSRSDEQSQQTRSLAAQRSDGSLGRSASHLDNAALERLAGADAAGVDRRASQPGYAHVVDGGAPQPPRAEPYGGAPPPPEPAAPLGGAPPQPNPYQLPPQQLGQLAAAAHAGMLPRQAPFHPDAVPGRLSPRHPPNLAWMHQMPQQAMPAPRGAPAPPPARNPPYVDERWRPSPPLDRVPSAPAGEPYSNSYHGGGRGGGVPSNVAPPSSADGGVRKAQFAPGLPAASTSEAGGAMQGPYHLPVSAFLSGEVRGPGEPRSRSLIGLDAPPESSSYSDAAAAQAKSATMEVPMLGRSPTCSDDGAHPLHALLQQPNAMPPRPPPPYHGTARPDAPPQARPGRLENARSVPNLQASYVRPYMPHRMLPNTSSDSLMSHMLGPAGMEASYHQPPRGDPLLNGLTAMSYPGPRANMVYPMVYTNGYQGMPYRPPYAPQGIATDILLGDRRQLQVHLREANSNSFGEAGPATPPSTSAPGSTTGAHSPEGRAASAWSDAGSDRMAPTVPMHARFPPHQRPAAPGHDRSNWVYVAGMPPGDFHRGVRIQQPPPPPPQQRDPSHAAPDVAAAASGNVPQPPQRPPRPHSRPASVHFVSNAGSEEEHDEHYSDAPSLPSCSPRVYSAHDTSAQLPTAPSEGSDAASIGPSLETALSSLTQTEESFGSGEAHHHHVRVRPDDEEAVPGKGRAALRLSGGMHPHSSTLSADGEASGAFGHARRDVPHDDAGGGGAKLKPTRSGQRSASGPARSMRASSSEGSRLHEKGSGAPQRGGGWPEGSSRSEWGGGSVADTLEEESAPVLQLDEASFPALTGPAAVPGATGTWPGAERVRSRSTTEHGSKAASPVRSPRAAVAASPVRSPRAAVAAPPAAAPPAPAPGPAAAVVRRAPGADVAAGSAWSGSTLSSSVLSAAPGGHGVGRGGGARRSRDVRAAGSGRASGRGFQAGTQRQAPPSADAQGHDHDGGSNAVSWRKSE